MADFSPNDVLRIPGQLFLNVTNLAIAGYGGTAVGFFEHGQMVVHEESEDIISEALGRRTGKLIAETLLGFEFDLVQFDIPVLGFSWGGTATVLREPTPGLVTLSGPALFAALDPAHPSLLVYAPAYLNKTKTVPWGSMDTKRRERMFLDACEDANSHTYACGLLSNLSLT